VPDAAKHFRDALVCSAADDNGRELPELGYDVATVEAATAAEGKAA
jgi:hypothetical protein